MFSKKFVLSFLAGLLIVVNTSVAVAQSNQSTKAKQAILIEESTGTVLLEKNADDRMPTSSMSKVMTVYMIFQAIEEGRLSLSEKLPVSKKAWKKGGSKMFVEVGKKVKLEDLLRGVIIQSGNDATIVLAEGMSGTEEVFAESMTQQAHAMGMENSQFKNASGWPDPDHYSTARDLSILARRLIKDFPQYYSYFAEKSFKFNDIEQTNRNALLFRNIGVDGIKTGHTEAGGYGLMSSAVRNGRRLTLIVNGLDSEQSRADESARLLDWGFRSFENTTLLKKGEEVAKAPVWLGVADEVPLVTNEDIVLTLPAAPRDKEKIVVTAVYDGPVAAPIKRGDKIGVLKVEVPGLGKYEYDLSAGAPVGTLGLFPKTMKKAKHFLMNR